MQTLVIRITGISPLLMHNARFANPLDPATKAHKTLTSKRKKTDEDHFAIAKSEFLGSIYHDNETGVYLPGINMEACLFEAAKMQKLGKTSKRSLLVLNDKIKIQYSGPKTPEKLYEDSTFVDVRAVKVGMSKLMRYRPKFAEWSAEFQLSFNPEQIEERDIIRILEDAGSLVGVGDYRPRFGKFSVEVSNG
jgi:hypothetical protein